MSDNHNSGNAEPVGGPTLSNPPDPSSQVNAQILDAVSKSTAFAFGLENQLQPPVKDGTRLSSGAAIAFEKVAQASAFAIQDATDYQRNVLSMSNVAQGKALAMMFVDKQNIPKYAEILVLAILASVAATFTAGEAGTLATKTVTNFPRG